MTHNVHLNVNNDARDMQVEPWRTLLDVLTEDYRLARTKEGCSVGECGGCSVSMDGKMVNSCLVLAVDADGAEIITMENEAAGMDGFGQVMEDYIHPDVAERRANHKYPIGEDAARVHTFCHLCPGHCSMTAIVEAGRVVDLEPEMESGLYAEQCALNKGRFTIPEVMGHKDRLLYPQKRVGARGGGEWQRITWDEALDTIAAKFTHIKETLGAESVAFGLGEPKGLEFAFAQRLATAFGTPSVVTPGWSCGIPKGMAAAFTLGSGVVCDDDNMAEVLVLWGSNMNQTTGGIRRETLEKVIEAGGKLVVVDPQKTDIAKLADLWIRIKPGSDGAFAAGVLKVIIEEELYDADIVAEWTLGFDLLKEELAGVSLGEVEELSWVPVEQIKEFARLYASGNPTTMQTGNAVDQLVNSFQTGRIVAIMRGICGNINVPGGDVTLTAPAFTRPGSFFLLSKYPRNAEKILGDQFKFAQRSAFIPPHVLTKAILEEDPVPIKAAMFILTNPVVSYPNSAETYEAFMKLDFIVVSELFMTPTAAIADIVLPAAWGMEHEELG
ncbi:MAG: molybdopterin-dependent oxidoreductase, partial [Rhodospirillales bacterium]|nr:molybdopterin-dependent oxidoreductase [Rhodospirillales bacterium]